VTDETPARPSLAHRATGLLPLAGATAAIVLAALAVPSVRHTLAASFQRQSAPYVELYFAHPAAARACTVTNGRLHLAISLRSHLTSEARVRYRVATSAGTGRAVPAVRGALVTTPGATTTVPVAVAVPHRPYAVAVTLPGRTQQLLLHCPTPAAHS
jgi:hypothetical protein